ncbi:MAG: carboxymuconolactone decarboxylase [Betaproteobacteria bacterium]|jgi:4-carboxymuconolactone decarboxylase|nr:carboxymuconolactone decarboxylase [Betaproteobacteria bacterium]NBS45742.1 carboxymuconolactone decarboxylase [Betaproteobacteria bacterium]
MMKLMLLRHAVFAVCLGSLLCLPAHAQESQRRFKILQPEEMTQAQKDLVRSIASGPRASVQGSAANSGGGTVGSPFNVFLRSPELGEHLQRVGSYIRFKSSLGMKLNELAILIVARHWSAQYEWFAHHRLALQAGLDPAVAEDIAQGRRPASMKPDEELVYNFVTELLNDKRVGDANYKAVLDKFGEQGVMDLIGVAGYYVLVAMVLNVDRTPIPNDGKPPLPVLAPR